MSKLLIPNLLEFLYDCFDSRTKDYLFERLTREELKKVKSKSKIKLFVERAPLEDVAILLSKINCGFGWVIWDNEKVTKTTVKDILIANLEMQGADLTRHIIKSKIFATQSIDIIKSLQVTSKASHSKMWSVNRKYLEISKFRRPEYNPRNIENKLQAEETLKWYTQTIGAVLKLAPLLEHYKISVTHFQLLLFLQNCPNGATMDTLKKEVNNSTNFRAMILRMHRLNMIEIGADKNIVSLGVNGYVTVDAIISKLP